MYTLMFISENKMKVLRWKPEGHLNVKLDQLTFQIVFGEAKLLIINQ